MSFQSNIKAGMAAIAVLSFLFVPTSSPIATEAKAARFKSTINVWWPSQDATLTGVQPFKALVQDMPVTNYKMYWQVDGGSLNKMGDSYADYPHKESEVDVSTWTWKGSGPYSVSFKAVDNTGRFLAERKMSVMVAHASSATTASSSTDIETSQDTKTNTATSSNPFAGTKLYVNPNSNAKRQADEWRTSRPADAALMDKIASGAQSFWLGGWYSDIALATNNIVTQVNNAQSIPVLVAYNIPGRDCGSYSAGGSGSEEAYKTWIHGIAKGINGRPAVVILEPDALAQIDCLNAADQASRLSLLNYAVETLEASPATAVYLDAGHARWLSADVAASRLRSAGIAKAEGFALNVSNYVATSESANYGNSLSSLVGGKRFVIDTSRNGKGPSPDGQWCNPSGRGIGALPTTATNLTNVDALLWIKDPGSSDGTCNGGPSAGQWWAAGALELALNAAF